MDEEIDTSIIDDWLEVYEYGHHEVLDNDTTSSEVPGLAQWQAN